MYSGVWAAGVMMVMLHWMTAVSCFSTPLVAFQNRWLPTATRVRVRVGCRVSLSCLQHHNESLLHYEYTWYKIIDQSYQVRV